MTYTNKRCPHCRKTYESYTNHTKRLSNHSGSPFLTCKFCGKTFVDTDIKEPALKPYSDRGYSILNCFLGFLCRLLIPSAGNKSGKHHLCSEKTCRNFLLIHG